MLAAGFFFRRVFCRSLFAFGCCCLGSFGGTVPAQSPGALTRAFDLPADVAEKTLKLFSEQSGRGLIVAAEMAINIRTNAVRGRFTVREALDRMLAGTGLAAKEDPKNGAFVVHRENPGPNGQRAAQTTGSDRPDQIKSSIVVENQTKTKSMRTMKSSKNVTWLASLFAFATAIDPLSAQASKAAPPEPDKVIELSPFVITAEQDTGYQATSTLSGTRLRTDLRDLAASISVVTKDLMDDLAVNSLEQLATYTLGTEIGGPDGNFSDTSVSQDFTSFDGTMRDPPPRVRVRGISGGASRTRDYFLTNIGGDAYNTERIDIQRGPNGMLFGLGSPQGVINEGMIKANPQRNSTKVSTRFGSYDGYRGSIDHNQVLLKDKLALRLAGVYDDTRYQIEEAFRISRRGYGTLTYKPWRNTVLRASGEIALTEGIPAQSRPPNDQFTYWWAVGMPVYNASTGVASFLGTPPSGSGFTGNPAQFLSSDAMRGTKVTLVIENPATGAYGLSIPGNPQAAEFRQSRVRRNATDTGWVNDGHMGLQIATNYVRQLRAPVATDPSRNFFRLPQVTDPAIFNYFDHQLDGPASPLGARWRTANIALEQRLGQHAGLELAYDRQKLEDRSRWAFGFNRYALKLDVTSVLASGLPNPNFGRPFLADSGFGSSKTTLREAFRATAYYDLDFKRCLRPDSLLAKIIGRHVFTSNYTSQSRDYVRWLGIDGLGLDYLNQEETQFAPAAPASTFRVFSGLREVIYAVYVGPSMVGKPGPQNQGIQGLQKPIALADTRPGNITVYNYETPPAAATVAPPWTIKNFNTIIADDWYRAATATGSEKTREKFKALAFVTQSHWFENTLVSTVGWRRDWIKTFDARGAALDSATGVLISDPAIYRVLPRLDQKHDAINYGLVLHAPGFVRRRLPKWIELSLTHNRSDNFTPEAARLDVYGRDIDPTGGTTKEYGALVSLFDRKIDLRISNYTTASTKATLGQLTNIITGMDRQFYRVANLVVNGQLDFFPDEVTPTTAERQAYLAFMRSPEASPFLSEKVAGYSIDTSGQLRGSNDGSIGRVFGTSDVVAKGWEAEVTANPFKSWRVTLNVARQETVLSDVGNELAALFESWKPALIDGRAGDLPSGAGSTLSMRDWFRQQVASLSVPRALQGSKSPELREWRFNAVNNYSFHEGRLKGWNVGGAVRWQDKAAIGYPVISIGGQGQYDVTKPYYGPTETNVDAWVGYARRLWNDRVGWKAQLNVRNIGVRNRLIPVSAQPYGEIDTYRTGASMTWSLTNSFTF